MKLFCRKDVRGAISLFLVAILLPMMVISALMVDTARYHLAKAMVSNAGDLAMNGALADYDSILKDVYGLFAMSQADDVTKNVKRYFEETLISYGVVGEEDAGSYVQELLGYLYEYLLVEDRETADFLAMTMEPSDLEVTKVEGSSLAEPSILEKQIVEYMKYRGPVDFGMSFLDSLSAFTKVDAQAEVLQAQIDAQSGLEGVSQSNYALYHAIRVYDKKYDELEPGSAPPNGRHLKNYGHIFKEEYVKEYEKLHLLTLAFCVKAHLGKWELPDSNRSDSGFFILSEKEDYIVENNGVLSVTGHLSDSHAAFGESSADPLNRYIKPFLNDRQSVVGVLKSYGAEVKIKDSGLEIEDEANWETVMKQFGEVDAFYQFQLQEYALSVKRLDEYAKAMEAYAEKANNEIEQLKKQKEQARSNKMEIVNQRAQLAKERDLAAARLSVERMFNAVQVQNAEEYLKNENRLKELEALTGKEAEAADSEMTGLREKNQQIEDALGKERLDGLRGDLIAVNEFSQKDGDLEKKASEENANQSSYEDQLKKKTEESNGLRNTYQEILKECRDYVNSFNRDSVNYKQYKKKTEEFITRRALNIGSEFRELFVKVINLKDLVDAASEKFEAAQQDVNEYMKQVEKWDQAKDGYVNDGSGQEDGFSQVQEAQITEAENVFSGEEVKKLGAAIQKELERLHCFVNDVNENFKYMGREKIIDITNAKQIADTIDQSGSETFELTHDIDADGLKELAKLTEPLPCCAFMNYLHQTYQERYALGNQDRAEENLTPAEKSAKSTYDAVKKSNDIAKGVEGDTGSPEKYGYQYQKRDNAEDSLPAKEGGKKADKEGMKENRTLSKNLLSGLGSAMETGRDKLYVMAYLFDNFSYNTVVQDRVREDGKEPSWTNCENKIYEAYVPGDGRSAKPAAFTGSGIPVNALNNVLYGAEIEYVLFGNKHPSENVRDAKLGIYAVRVLFNSVYAFTSSDIRNQTRAVALAVQAASCGMVPYQVVQVVLQLALALGESAIDLKNMEAGAKVVIVKTRDTWMLGMESLAKGAIKSGIDKAADVVADMAQKKIGQIADAGADEVSKFVQNVEKDLTGMANGAAENMLDGIFARIDALVDEAMNQAAEDLFYSENGLQLLNPEDLGRKVMERYGIALDALKGSISKFTEELAGQHSDNALLSAACKAGGTLANTALDDLYLEMEKNILELQDAVSIRGFVYRQIYSAKAKISEKVQGAMGGLISQVSGSIQTEINQVAGDIKKKAQEMTGQAKEDVTKRINEFVDKKLSFGAVGLETGTLSQANGNPAQSSVKASAITFGYSDYLRLFVFVGLCASDKSGSMIRRIGDLIEWNISSAKEGSELAHRCGSQFSMEQAKTYISIKASVKLEMMFLNLGIFRRQMDDFGREYQDGNWTDPGNGMRVEYLGISGY